MGQLTVDVIAIDDTVALQGLPGGTSDAGVRYM